MQSQDNSDATARGPFNREMCEPLHPLGQKLAL
jgi:hypothetical protein